MYNIVGRGGSVRAWASILGVATIQILGWGGESWGIHEILVYLIIYKHLRRETLPKVVTFHE